MSVLLIVITVLGLGVIGYFAGRHRAIASAGDERRQLHSLPVYYGVNVVLPTVVPALGVLFVLLIAVPIYINSSVSADLPDSIAAGFLSPNSAMPAQIFGWSKRVDPAYYERAWGGIIILLVFLMTMNIIAIILRRRFERRW